MTRKLIFVLLTGAVGLHANAGERNLVLDVWPAIPPGETGKVGPEHFQDDKPGAKRPVKRLTNVTRPTLTVFKPAKDKDTGAAVLIAPGGGYSILAWDLEGEEVAAWLNTVGVTGIVLKYRVPRRPGESKDVPPPGPLTDAQRSLSVVRSQAGKLGIDPKRLGMLGFSAGGHLTAATATTFDKRSYSTIDAADQHSCRPDFVVLVYPAYLVEKDTVTLKPQLRVTKDTPPMFFAHAADDPVSPDNSIGLFLALRKAKVPAELHIYSSGGHGFGLRSSADACSTWPQRCETWLQSQGILTKNAKK